MCLGEYIYEFIICLVRTCYVKYWHKVSTTQEMFKNLEVVYFFFAHYELSTELWKRYQNDRKCQLR